MHRQITDFINPKLSQLLCGFRKCFNMQHALVRLIEKWRNALDKKNKVEAGMIDLSKAFDCLKHDLLIAKLSAYGFDRTALNLVNDYLKNRYQRVKVDGNFSSWKELKLGVPQGSVLGSLLFNIFINDFLTCLQESEVCNYADDNSIFVCDTNFENDLSRLETDLPTVSEWFSQNFMKLNQEKSHFLTLGHNNDAKMSVRFDMTDIECSSDEKLLGVVIDDQLNFDKHINNICRKAANKLSALARISKYMDPEKLKCLMKTFVMSQFQYFPLVWMCHSRGLNQKINKIHERALRIAYKDFDSDFEELLRKDSAVTVHEKVNRS